MAFTTAAAAKALSDAVILAANPAVGSLTETLINTEIAVQTARTDLNIKHYTASFRLDADVNGRTSPVDIVQSDSSRIMLIDLINALNDAGHRTSNESIKVDGGQDIVTLTIAWDT